MKLFHRDIRQDYGIWFAIATKESRKESALLGKEERWDPEETVLNLKQNVS